MALPPTTLPAAALLVGALTATGLGLLPIAGLSLPRRATPVVAPVAPPPPPVPVECKLPAAIFGPARATASHPAVTVEAALGHATFLRSTDATTGGVAWVRVAEAGASEARPPVDLALVIDTSGSMAEAMPLLKRAALGLVERLGPDDRLVLVEYSTDSTVLFQGPLTGDAPAQLERLIGRLVPRGGTNIEAGLRSGQQALLALRTVSTRASLRARRLVLMTDGRATAGATAPRDLLGLVTAGRGSSIPASCVGLGLDYAEDLLSGLADAGGGAFHHVASGEGLPAVYEAELRGLRGLALRDARLVLESVDGRTVPEVASWSSRLEGTTRVVPLGDLAHGQAVKVVFRAAPAFGGDGVRLVRVRLEATTLAGTPVSLTLPELGAPFANDPAEYAASAHADAIGAIRDAEVAARLEAAREASTRGDPGEARRQVQAARDAAGAPSIAVAAPSGETRTLDFERLEQDLAAPADSALGRAAQKAGAEAARAAAR
jgi:Ca-activated chloride channel family protein